MVIHCQKSLLKMSIKFGSVLSVHYLQQSVCSSIVKYYSMNFDCDVILCKSSIIYINNYKKFILYSRSVLEFQSMVKLNFKYYQKGIAMQIRQIEFRSYIFCYIVEQFHYSPLGFVMEKIGISPRIPNEKSIRTSTSLLLEQKQEVGMYEHLQ